MQVVNLESIATAVIIAIIFAFAKLFRDVGDLRISVKPVVEWYVKTSMDALKIATNPTSERLAELADRYIAANVRGDRKATPLNAREMQELIDGLRNVLNDRGQNANKRQSASLSLRFIETRERMTSHSVGYKERTEH